MKKGLLYLVLLVLIPGLYLQVSAQSSITETSRSLFKSLNIKRLIYQPDEYDREIDSLLLKLKIEIRNNFFTADHEFISCLDSNKYILEWMGDEQIPVMEGEYTLRAYKLFRYSLKYSGLKNEELTDSLWRNREYALLPVVLSKMSYQYLDDKFKNFSNCEDVSDFLSSFYNDSIAFTKYFQLVENNLDKVKACDKSYARYLISIKYSNYLAKKDSILEQERILFFKNLDTSTAERRFIRDQIFLNLPDSFTLELMRQWKLENEHYDDSIRRVIKIQREEENRVRDSINNIFVFENLTPEEKLEYLVASDTTFWQNGYSYSVEGDDGMRFDTLSNKELIKILDQLDFHSIYDTIISGAQINSNAVTIHLQKIFQLLGDRYVYGLFKPTKKQLKKLNKLVDIYANYIRPGFNTDIAEESIMQIMRLWNMMEHKYYEWLEDGNDQLYHFVLYHFNPIIDENILRELVSRADKAKSEGNDEMVLKYAMVINNVDSLNSLEYVFKPQRRPYRSDKESKRLSILYVYPALRKYNLIP